MKSVYLTIDDSPTPRFKEKFEFLYSKNIPAVFFCIGNLMEENSDVMIEAIHKGFHIGNHSYSHPAFSSLTLEECKYEIKKTDDIIDWIYQKANVERTEKWFRFPYGDKGDLKKGFVFSWWRKSNSHRKNTIQTFLKDLGYTQPAFKNVSYNFMHNNGLFTDIDWSWSFDVMEWALLEKKPTLRLNTEEKILQRLKKERPKDCRGFLGFEKRWLASDADELLLLHDHEPTSDFFPTIIEALEKLSIQFSDFKNL